MGAVLGQVHDAGREAVRVQAHPQRVHRRDEQLGRDAAGEDPHRRPVAGHEVPPAIHDQGGERLVACEYPVEGVAHRSHLGGVQGRLAIDGRIPRGQEQGVSFPKRHVQVLGEMQDELPARPGPARLDEAQVPGRDRRLQGHVELAQPPPPPPVSEQPTHATRGRHGAHDGDGSATLLPPPLPRR